MKRSKMMILVVASLAVFISACQNGPTQEHLQRTEEIGYNTVVFADYDLNRNFAGTLIGADKVIRLSVEKHGVSRTDTGTSEVWAILRNHTDYPYMVEARTTFYNQDGMPMDANPVWKRVSVPANALATYKEKSITTEQLQYRVEVRQAK